MNAATVQTEFAHPTRAIRASEAEQDRPLFDCTFCRQNFPLSEVLGVSVSIGTKSGCGLACAGCIADLDLPDLLTEIQGWHLR
jgi:hypothetical protein